MSVDSNNATGKLPWLKIEELRTRFKNLRLHILVLRKPNGNRVADSQVSITWSGGSSHYRFWTLSTVIVNLLPNPNEVEGKTFELVIDLRGNHSVREVGPPKRRHIDLSAVQVTKCLACGLEFGFLGRWQYHCGSEACYKSVHRKQQRNRTSTPEPATNDSEMTAEYKAADFTDFEEGA
jgi:hypothetical protein